MVVTSSATLSSMGGSNSHIFVESGGGAISNDQFRMLREIQQIQNSGGNLTSEQVNFLQTMSGGAGNVIVRETQ